MAAPTNLFDTNSIKRFMPPFMRQSVHVNWLVALMKRARSIYITFSDNQLTWDRKRTYSSQTASLEAYLRLFFTESNIYVLNLSNSSAQVFTFWLDESQTKPYIKWLSEAGSPTYVRFLEEYDNSNLNYDFIVRFPASFAGQSDLIISIVNSMKLAGKRWKLEFV